MIFFGPGSIYCKDRPLLPNFKYYGAYLSNSNVHLRSTHKNFVMVQCLALFFMWQYPSFPVVDRDCFLRDFSSDYSSERNLSPLLHSICALGALMSTDTAVQGMAAYFFILARDELAISQAPRPSNLQALLCCAYYTIGQGDTSSGWMYSGL